MKATEYTYDQWREVSDAIGDAMEYAHDRAIEFPDKADPLWNLDEYVNRVLEAAFGTGATLGGGTLTAEQMREAIESNSWAETSTIREFNGSAWQAIADELNATLRRGECHDVDKRSYAMTCSECKATVLLEVTESGEPTYTVEGVADVPKYCPNCGRKVVG